MFLSRVLTLLLPLLVCSRAAAAAANAAAPAPTTITTTSTFIYTGVIPTTVFSQCKTTEAAAVR